MDNTESIKLDPNFATGLIAQAAHIGAQEVTVDGAAANNVGRGGVSPMDAAVSALGSAEAARLTGWSGKRASSSATLAAGGQTGVGALSETEAHNAARLGEVGLTETV